MASMAEQLAANANLGAFSKPTELKKPTLAWRSGSAFSRRPYTAEAMAPVDTPTTALGRRPDTSRPPTAGVRHAARAAPGQDEREKGAGGDVPPLRLQPAIFDLGFLL